MRIPLPPNYKPTITEERFDKIELWTWISLPFIFIILLGTLLIWAW